MFIPVGLALGALSTVSSLVESAASSLAKSGGNNPLSALAQAFTGEQPAATASATPAAAKFDSGTLATLISLQGQGGTAKSGGLFGKLDADGDGAISKSEFESAFGKAGVDRTSADAAFGKLDANGDGSISKSELGSPAAYHHRHRRHAAQLAGLQAMLSNPAAGTTTTVA
jgi:hypothetical protein